VQHSNDRASAAERLVAHRDENVSRSCFCVCRVFVGSEERLRPSVLAADGGDCERSASHWRARTHTRAHTQSTTSVVHHTRR
jgi:hypothetical protein